MYCKKVIPADAKTFPFCSERCRMNDLGNWLGEHYVVPGAREEDTRNVEGSDDEDVDPSDKLH